jgi:hypothetical protein
MIGLKKKKIVEEETEDDTNKSSVGQLQFKKGKNNNI